MHALFVLFVLGCVLPGALSAPQGTQGTTQPVYDKLQWYWKYAVGAYAEPNLSLGETGYCPHPNGNTTWVMDLNSPNPVLLASGTQGYIAVDQGNREIVVAFRGTEANKAKDLLTDAKFVLKRYVSATGVTAPSGLTQVHSGFLDAYNSVEILVNNTVTTQLKAHPGYDIVVTGHSLGGALASLAAASLKNNFKNSNVSLYTYGQPRTGNSAYAEWINSLLGAYNKNGIRVFRSVHTTDIMPTIPKGFYYHHGVEYWQNVEPAKKENIKVCPPTCLVRSRTGGCTLLSLPEDLTCSANPLLAFTKTLKAHSKYYGITTDNPEQYCQKTN